LLNCKKKQYSTFRDYPVYERWINVEWTLYNASLYSTLFLAETSGAIVKPAESDDFV